MKRWNNYKWKKILSCSRATAPRMYTSLSVATYSSSSSSVPDCRQQDVRAQFSCLVASEPKEFQPLSHVVAYYLKHQMRVHQHKTAILVPANTEPNIFSSPLNISFAQLRKCVDGIAEYFLDIGIRASDRVLLYLPGAPEAYLVQLACARIGALCAVAPPTTDAISAEALRLLLDIFQPRHLIARRHQYSGGNQGKGKRWNFHNVLLQLIPELSLRYPGQLQQIPMSQEFPDLVKVTYLDAEVVQNQSSETPISSASLLPLTKRPLTWGPRSYYESRLRRYEFLLHPEDALIALPNPNPSLEDKIFLVFSHQACLNAGALFARVVGIAVDEGYASSYSPNAQEIREPFRMAVLPGHHTDPIGAIIGPYASLLSGASLIHLNENPHSLSQSLRVVLKQIVDTKTQGLLGTLEDLDLLMKDIKDASQKPRTKNANADASTSATPFDPAHLSLEWIALFEDANKPPASDATLRDLVSTFGVKDVWLFRGTMESSWMLSARSAQRGPIGILPFCGVKIVGDRGTSDAKILFQNTRGQLRVLGPHITPFFHNNAGVLAEFVDSDGWVATSSDGIISSTVACEWQAMLPQMY